MQHHGLCLRKTFVVSCFFLCAVHPQPTSALPATPDNSSDPVLLPSQSPLYLAQQRECSQRVGPFVTQDTAWRRWRDARSQGQAVSNGIVPCPDGYCFYVFYRC